MKENGNWWIADNRRLWIFRHLEKLGKCREIPVDIINSIDSRKRSSTNGGIDVYTFLLKVEILEVFGIAKLSALKTRYYSEPKDMNNEILNVPVVQSHEKNQFEIGCITDCISSDNKILKYNDQHTVEAIRESPCATTNPDSISSIVKSEYEKLKHYLNMKRLESDDMGMEMNAILLENLLFPFGHRNSEIPTLSYKSECKVSNRINSRNTSDVIPKRSFLHQSSRYTPYNRESKFGYFEHVCIQDKTRHEYSQHVHVSYLFLFRSEDSDEESSDDSDIENSDDSKDDNFYYSDDEYLDLSDNDTLMYSQKKNHKESSDIVYDSFHNSVDEFRCYDYLSKELDDEDSCDSESSTISNGGDHYTAVLDKAYLSGCYNSDVDNMIYDYID
ncbi:unnamed protein product [Mytilus edulis]|uniref:Uncharacterized protein n=1 Tax=Mytilus edulis TaxID=6550 RepID=A0A8S3SEX4_MYTED|nr:unnamed protein product [Mytilus edulis]